MNDFVQKEKMNLSSLVVVDDEEEILKALKSLFRREKYNIQFFSSGAEALQFLEHNCVDVIICDMRMPEISGIELLERSAIVNPDAIRIMLSGYEEKNVVLDAIQSGFAQNYIIKPWDDQQLRSIVKEALELKERLKKKHLLSLLYPFQNLPSPPKLHSRLIKILRSETKSQKEIVHEIEKNPALVAKLLRLSNSVFYSTRKQISDISEAISFIGTEFVLSIVLGHETFNILKKDVDPLIVKQIEAIREISILRAHVARELSIQWLQINDQHEIYVAALLLDIGLILRFYSAPERFYEFYNAYKNKNEPMYFIDKEIFSTTHDIVGAALLTYWNFPNGIIDAVENHHSRKVDNTLITIIQLADAMVQKNDSHPHDPCIEKYLKQWGPTLIGTIEKLKESSDIFE